MKRLIAYSFFVEAIVSAVLVLTFKLAGEFWGADGFGAWTLARRIIAFALPLTTIGIEVALPRYIPFDNQQPAENYLYAGAVLTVCGICCTTVLLFSAPDLSTQLLFGSADLRNLLFPLWALLTSYSVHILYFAFVRGHLKFFEANLLHLWAFGVAPLIAFSLASQTPEQAMTMNAVLVGCVPVVTLAYTAVTRRFDVRSVFPLVRTVAGYGMSRMFTALALTVLALLPPLIAAKDGGLALAGAVGLGITLIGFSGTIMSPVALVLLPSTALQIGRGDVGAFGRSYKLIRNLMLPIVVAAFVVIWIAAPYLARTFIQEHAESATRILRVAGVGTGFYAVFSLMRPLLDAATERPRVFHCTIAAGAAFAMCWIGGVSLGLRTSPLLPIAAYSTSIVVLALAACLFARQQLTAS